MIGCRHPILVGDDAAIVVLVGTIRISPVAEVSLPTITVKQARTGRLKEAMAAPIYQARRDLEKRIVSF